MTLLFLNSLGTGEVLLILFVVLILFGSKGIPDFAKNLGKGMKEIRNASNEIKRDIQKSALEMRKDLNMPDTMQDITKIPEDLGKGFMGIENKEGSTEKKDSEDQEQKDIPA
ncbi:MAG: twin-arginine translocase TatA/TatE family subunit [Crocinitomicaceae bacterium]|nr:twin-arginine translocase TatA/TatE family subunit [Crocinitomicaceae bacterium]